jgi:hypothetical protein
MYMSIYIQKNNEMIKNNTKIIFNRSFLTSLSYYPWYMILLCAPKSNGHPESGVPTILTVCGGCGLNPTVATMV